ncbi:glioma pathogenesis-related protein 1b isoform X3 [Pangasianodon hypophthalmus]|uniref:glioma pathogenesis-related protein 1b isoform X3 n=1 Tax=Pangasianodon hypophthalmus TaxID=310915 RepID=UPI00147BB488|nr:glioma pathogenesis-related protein 1b isoform X3 [Pangasianodon hypophthalmus]
MACPQHDARATHQYSLYSGCINALTHSLTHSHTLTHINTLTHTLSHTLSHINTLSHSLTHSLTHSSVRENLSLFSLIMDLLTCTLLWISALLSGPSGARAFMLPDISEPEFIRRCVQAHNVHRSRAQPPAANMRSMSWDDSLARGARSWARHCRASHNPVLKQEGKAHPAFRHVGENIWLGAPYSAFTVESAVNSWNKEGADYTLANNSCARLCGHYTQLMWATSYKVGCAVHVCSRGIENFSKHPESTIFVCNYGDAGNVFGFTPYIVGLACSKCGMEKCRDKLCRYDWVPGWDLGPSGSAQAISDWLNGSKLQLLAGSFWLLYFYAMH